ncbi:MAG: hypothetical protein KGQ95_01475 [Acidobacteria bacterium]|nr:hypothetical protein [Acidobacteriota bacterium]
MTMPAATPVRSGPLEHARHRAGRRAAALVAAALVGGTCLASAGAASAAPPLTITAFRVMDASGRKPATQPLTRGVAYRYRLDYRVGGRVVVQLRRSGAFWSPYGDKLVSIRPRPQTADPGRYFASDPIRVARSESPGEYRLTYQVTATDRAGSTTRTAELRMRFR